MNVIPAAFRSNARRTIATVMVSASLIASSAATRAQGLSLYEMFLVPPAVSVSGDNGGNIAQYLLRTEAYRETQTQVSIEGRCDSACTLYLSLSPEQICIEQHAYFRFHTPIANSQGVQRMATLVMMEHYPDWVKDWIFQQGGLTRHFKTMDYAYASQFIQPCTELAVASNSSPSIQNNNLLEFQN
jgi:hypothetical protein